MPELPKKKVGIVACSGEERRLSFMPGSGSRPGQGPARGGRSSGFRSPAFREDPE